MPETLLYLCDRSRDEAIRAIQATHPVAAALHEELCLIYTGRALASLARRGR